MTSSSPTSAAAYSVDATEVGASYGHCRDLTRARAKNFYYGMMLTPQPKRSAMYAVYAWMRAVDDLGDPAGGGEAESVRRRLESFRRRTQAALAGEAPWPGGQGDADAFAPMWPAVAATFRDYAVPRAYLDAMIDGQIMDQRKTRYASFDELYEYCYNVASTVGLVCITVWGYDGGEATRKLAQERGIALQLTNILRDVVEDAQRDRVYLPADELARFGFDDESFKAHVLRCEAASGGDFDGLIRMQLCRAREYYNRSASLERFVTGSCRPTCWAMMRIYEGLLSKMESNPRRVLTERVRMGRLSKLAIALRATWRRGLRVDR